MRWTSKQPAEPPAELAEIVSLLNDLAGMLMGIDAKARRSSHSWRVRTTMEIEPTAEDRERVLARLANPREQLVETLVRHEARRRIEREQRERKRSLLHKLSLGLLGR